MKMIKVKIQKAYMIGHAFHDIEMGKNAKINTTAIKWGYNTKEGLQQASAD